MHLGETTMGAFIKSGSMGEMAKLLGVSLPSGHATYRSFARIGKGRKGGMYTTNVNPGPQLALV